MNAVRYIWPFGIRVQLMLWYTMVFAVLILLAATIFYTQLQTSLITSLDSTLQLEAQQIANGVSDEQGTITIDDVIDDLPGFERPDLTKLESSHANANFDVLVRILTANGHVFRMTPAFRQLLVPAESAIQPLRGIPWQGIVTTRDGQQVRLYSRVLVDHGAVFGVIQVGSSLTQMNTALHSVVVALLILAPIVLLLSALVSYWLTSHALLPIQRLIQTARVISTEDLQQRVPVPRAHDEVRELALALNEMIKRLEDVFSRQRRFVADASHELRTPVSVIRTKIDMALLQAFSPQEYIAVLGELGAEAERLGGLISDLLTLARTDEGRTLLEREPVRLDLLVDAVVANAEVLATERDITLERVASEPVIVLGDEVRFIQVVMNLLENAIFYTNPRGRVTLRVQGKDTHAYLMVQDTGIGIAAEHLPYLFERFYRVDPARTRTQGGHSGLGLSIVDWVVRTHGGRVSVESQPGVGSTFTVILPLVASSSGEGDVQPPIPPPPP